MKERGSTIKKTGLQNILSGNKKLLWVIALLWLGSFSFVYAQPNIVKAEYFIDNEPGFGQGTAIAVTPGTQITNQGFSLDMSSLSAGVHQLFVRVQDANGAWSISNRNLFYKASAPVSGLPNLVKAEYFFDTEPGFGQGTNIPIIAGTQLLNQGFSTDISALSAGFHQLFVRVQDANGSWSISNRTFLYKGAPATGIIPALVKAEYFFDAEPGFGQGTNIPITAGTQVLNQNFSTDISALSAGFHQLFVRVKDANGVWSISNRTFLYKGSTAPAPTPAIVKAEYFYDTEPGFGNGTNIPVTSGTNLQAIGFISDISSLAAGTHQLFVRVKDANGAWSISNRTMLYKSPVVNNVAPDITKAEYFIDTDPGFGNGIPYPVLPHTVFTNNNITVNVTGLSNGTHKFYFRVMDSQGRWSISNVSDLVISNAVSAPQISITGIDQPLLCAGATIMIGYHATGTYTTGNVFRAELSDAAGSFAAPVTIGTDTTVSSGSISCLVPPGLGQSTGYKIRVSSTNPAVTGLPSAIPLTVTCAGTGPSITSFSPTSASTGATVTITGTNLSAASAVKFGGIAATSYIVLNSNTISAVVGSGASGNVSVTTGFGTASLAGFIFTAPQVPSCVNVTAPANGASAPSVGTLSWSAASGSPIGYQLYLGTDSLNLPAVATQTGLSYNYSLAPLTKYFWKIVPYNSNGNATGCAVWNFTTLDNPPSCAALVFPADHAANVAKNVTLTWEAASGAPTGYFVRIGTDSTNMTEYGTTGTSFQTNLNYNTVYFWKIVPYNINGSPASCPVRSFTTLNCGAPLVMASGALTLCSGQTVTLTADTGISYHWNTGAITRTITAAAGVYAVTVDKGSGCILSSLPDTVVNDLHPTINSGNISSICLGDSLTLSFNTASLLWNTGATTNAIIVHPSVATTYTVHGTSSTGCNYTDSIRIIINPSVAPGAVTNMFPIDGTTGLELPFNLSWLPGPNTSKYDLYVWPAANPQPGAAMASNLAAINYTLSLGSVLPGTVYKWQVVAKNGNCFSTAGPVQTFTTEALPDLIVENIVAPTAAASSNPISVSWKIKNIGQGGTGTHNWIDYIWLSADTILQDNPPASDFYLGGIPNLAALAPGESYINSATFTVPNGIGGNYHVIVKTNQLGTQNPISSFIETDNTNNLKVSDSFNILLSPSPDLQISSVITPINAFSGNNVQVTYTVKNKGVSVVNNQAQWLDNVYISFSPVFNMQTAMLLKGYTHYGSLLKDSSYTTTLSVSIPPYIYGLYNIYVVTDVNNELYEAPFENNNTGSNVINVYLSPPADLAMQNFTVPAIASTGAAAYITWSVKNVGANAFFTPWTDRVYVSPDPVFNNNATEIAFEDLSLESLPSGESYNGYAFVNMQLAYSGKYLYVVANADNDLFEYTYTQNNILRSDTTISITVPDLKVDTVITPASANSGDNIIAEWRIKNIGTGAIINKERVDSFYLSTQTAFNYNTAIGIGKLTFNESVAVNGSLSKQTSLTIPNGISGNYYLYVFTDAGQAIFENGSEANNISRSANPININLTASPDLVIQNIQVPSSLRSGFNMPISFTVKNLGTGAATGTTWTDKVYITPHAVWDNDLLHAQLLGTFTRTQSLGSNASYTVTDSVPVKVSATGKLIVDQQLLDSAYAYIHVVTDAGNQLYEYNGENNNQIVSDSVFVIPPRIDLQVTEVYSSDSAYAGQSANIYWEVKNNGVSTAYKGLEVPCYWYDGVYLSKDTVWDASDIFVFDWGYSNTPHDSTYEDNRNFIIPNGLSGYYYLLMVADHKFNLHEDVNRTNNYKLIRDENTGQLEMFHVLLPNYPDLVITQNIAPATATAGQLVKVKWTGKNTGPGATTGTGWDDAIYLSNDINPSADDILLGTVPHTGNLASGQTYTDSLDVTLPVTASGNYALIVETDVHNRVYEYQSEHNNSLYSFININQPPPSDLQVVSVQPPATALAGQPINITYTIKNSGAYPATGTMTDGIYLSKDNVWDIGDQLIGTKTSSINIAPGGQMVQTLNTQVTGASVGYYKVIVRTDQLNNIYETNYANNNGASTDSINIDVKQLPLNVLTPDTLLNNTYLYYRINIPDSLVGQTLLVTLQSDSLHAANEIYAKFGAVPSRSVNDFNYGTMSANSQELLIPALQRGVYYFAFYGSNPVWSNQRVALKAVILPFAIRNVNTNTGGNTGPVTIQLNGSKFEQGMQIRLDNGTGTIITANSVYYINSTKVFAAFDLRGRPTGNYNVIAQKVDSSLATLANGFHIVVGTGGGFYINVNGASAEPGCDPNATGGLNSTVQISLEYPATTRRNRVIAMTIFFGNSGTVDIPVPSRFVFSKGGAPLSFTVQGLAENLQALQLELSEANGPPNILRPGATGAVTIYTKSVAPMQFQLSD